MNRSFAFFGLFPLLLFAQDQQPGSVQGRVTNSLTGEPISGVMLTLFPTKGQTDQPTASSQEDGVFHFEEVAPGSYALAAAVNGYVPSNEFQKVVVAAGQNVTNLTVQLTPHSTISGKVLDDTGNPVAGAQVRAYATYMYSAHVRLRYVQTALSGKTGDYVLKGFPPGKFYITAEPPLESKGLVRTFYPKALDVDDASQVVMLAGQPLGKINITLRRAFTYHVRGRIADFSGESATVSLAPRGTTAADLQGASGHTAADGSFDLSEILPGSYTLWISGTTREGAGQRGAHPLLIARQDLDVGQDDINGLVLSVIPPLNLHGTVTFDGSTPAIVTGLRVLLVPTGDASFGALQNVGVAEDKSFSVNNLDPGNYLVKIQNLPTSFYLKAALWNHQDVTESGIDLLAGGTGELEILLREGTGAVSGMVQANPKSHKSTVILVSDVSEPSGSRSMSVLSQADGRFTIKGVPPGHYFAFATDRWTSLLQDSSFLRELQGQGIKVEVNENQTAQAAPLFVSADQLRQSAELLGLDLQ